MKEKNKTTLFSIFSIREDVFILMGETNYFT